MAAAAAAAPAAALALDSPLAVLAAVADTVQRPQKHGAFSAVSSAVGYALSAADLLCAPTPTPALALAPTPAFAYAATLCDHTGLPIDRLVLRRDRSNVRRKGRLVGFVCHTEPRRRVLWLDVRPALRNPADVRAVIRSVATDECFDARGSGRRGDSLVKLDITHATILAPSIGETFDRQESRAFDMHVRIAAADAAHEIVLAPIRFTVTWYIHPSPSRASLGKRPRVAEPSVPVSHVVRPVPIRPLLA